MNFDINVVSANAIVVVPIVIALVQAIKMMPWVKNYYSPLISIVVGIVISFLADSANTNFTHTLLSGVIYGLIASGLYSGIKTTMVAHARMEKQKEQQQAGKKDNC